MLLIVFLLLHATDGHLDLGDPWSWLAPAPPHRERHR
jgi:hypothetical protein